MAKICLVSCTREKLTREAPAEQLYASPLFGKSRAFAASRFDRWFILSAKYGLLEPSQIVEPYDKTLTQMSQQERITWAQSVLEELIKRTNPGDSVALLAGTHYRDPLIPLLSERGYKITVPLEGMTIGKQLSWLNRVLSAGNRIRHLDEFYDLLVKLRHGLGGSRILKDCTGRMPWPKRGVYFVFEPNELRASDILMQRVVRVGTHAVSRGSRSTLWSRLRTHRGRASGGGNHRSSIFRLHVGAAMIEKSAGGIAVPTWGKGQSAKTDTRTLETDLERRVSEYIGRMSILWLVVGDGPGPKNDRSFIEMNSIALLAGSDGPIDLASRNWLGRFSTHEAIRRSGLWNVNYVDDHYD
ncbi:MAG: DUF6884 domain-containing protein, partial [Anaerolineae bacterium]